MVVGGYKKIHANTQRSLLYVYTNCMTQLIYKLYDSAHLCTAHQWRVCVEVVMVAVGVGVVVGGGGGGK